MIIKNFLHFKGGWIVGNFKESIIDNPDYEIGVKKLKKGFVDKPHYHKEGFEYNLLIEGKLKQKDKIIEKNNLFIFEPLEVSFIKALEDSIILVFRNYSNPEDKFLSIQ